MLRCFAALLAFFLALNLGWPTSVDAAPTAQGMNAAGSEASAAKPAVLQVGSFDIAKVRILGVPAITVAVPVLANADGLDAGLRARLIENTLRLLYDPEVTCTPDELLGDLWVRRGVRDRPEAMAPGQPACDLNRRLLRRSPNDLTLATSISPSGLPVVEALVPDREPLPLVTVTDADARLSGLPPQELAERWRNTLELRLRHALEWYLPETRSRTLSGLGLALLLLMVVMAGLLLIWRRTQRWQARLEATVPLGDAPPAVLEILLQVAILVRLALFIAVLLVARAVVALATMALPGRFSQGLAQLLQPGLGLVKVLAVAFVVLILRALVAFLLREWLVSGRTSAVELPRRRQRYRTLRRTLYRLITLAAGVVLLVWWAVDLDTVRGISASGLLAGGALLGALVFVFQGLLRDLVAGLVVLVEDRYAIGDWIESGGHSGEVVDIGVLSAQFRTIDQQLVVVPHGLVDRLVNHTKIRSGALIRLTLSHRIVSLRQALRLIQRELDRFAAESPWKERLLAPPQLRAVDALQSHGIDVSVLMETTAGEQWPLSRELRRRVQEALHERGIPLASTLEWGTLPSESVTPAQRRG